MNEPTDITDNLTKRVVQLELDLAERSQQLLDLVKLTTRLASAHNNLVNKMNKMNLDLWTPKEKPYHDC